jgi:hypothetical protein
MVPNNESEDEKENASAQNHDFHEICFGGNDLLVELLSLGSGMGCKFSLGLTFV